MKLSEIRGKRGSYILEAAFLYPLIILISTALILLMLFLFSGIQDLALTGGEVRRAAGQESENVLYASETGSRYVILDRRNEVMEKSEVSGKKEGIVTCFSGAVSRKGNFPALFFIDARSDSEAIWTSLDEAHIIRTADLIFEKIRTG